MKIAIIDKFCNGPYGFSKSLVEHLRVQGHKVEHAPKYEPRFNKFDAIHFDWADEITASGVSQIQGFMGNPRVTVRLHAYEAHDGLAAKIQWQHVDSLIFVSKHYQKIFESLGTSQPKSKHVIWHGVDEKRFNYVEHSGKNILYAGSINFKKGPQLLAQAAMAFPNREVHVYGNIQCHRSRIYFDHLALPNLKFFPFQTDIENVMKDEQYEWILSTSLGESFHLAIAEGMACGLKPLVHDWYGAKELWTKTWRSIGDLKEIVATSKESTGWHRESEPQLDKMSEVIVGPGCMDMASEVALDIDREVVINIERPTIAACMVVSHFKGLERALKSCAQYLDAAFLAIDDREEPELVAKATELIGSLGLQGSVQRFDPPEPWDFSLARNIAHCMNTCNWAFVMDDDEYVIHPEEISTILESYKDVDTVEITCGMGDDGYRNIAHTWPSSRFMRKNVRWKNARHNIADPSTFSGKGIWSGEIVVVDDKSIKNTGRRTARSTQRNTNIEVFRKKIDENANDTRSMFYMAVAYREGGQFWEAIHWYKHYLATGGWDEERWQACFDIAICQMALKRWSEARDSLHQAIKEKFDRAEAFVLMGDIYYRCQDFHSAIIWYELGCALPRPIDARLFVRRGIYDWERYDKLSMAYSHLENWQAAINCAERVLIRRPGDPRVLANIEAWRSRTLHQENHIRDTPIVEVAFEGRKYAFHVSSFQDHIPKVMKRSGKFYEEELLSAIKNLELTGTYVDVGAHIGNHTVFFANECSSNKVISFEATPQTYQLLKKNCDTLIQKPHHVSQVPVLDDETKQVFVKIIDRNNTGMNKVAIPSPEDCVTTVGTTTLSEALKDEDQVSFMKIDVEGNELEVIRGAFDILKTHKPVLSIEDNGSKKVDEILSSLGYKRLGTFNTTPTSLWTV